MKVRFLTRIPMPDNVAESLEIVATNSRDFSPDEVRTYSVEAVEYVRSWIRDHLDPEQIVLLTKRLTK